VIDGVGRATIKELSEWAGRTGPSLYPHLEILEKAQFLTVEFETKKGRPYRVYCAGPALKWRSTAHGSTDTGGRAIKLAVQLLNDVILRLRRWGKVREGTPIERGAHASAKLIAETTWLDDEQREELNRRVADLMAFVRQARAERRGARHTVTIYHFPDVTLRAVREHRQAKELGQG
jgi:predicted ArsR family transcriptional regulator